MEPTLKVILFVFLFYSLMCLLPLWGSFKSTRRWELMVNGAYLVFLASFVLTGLTLVTGVVENFSGNNSFTKKEAAGISDFMQYIIFGGFFITFIFGSVGANVFCAGLLQNGNHEILRRLDSIEVKIDKLNSASIESHSYALTMLLIKIALFVGAIIILSWAM